MIPGITVLPASDTRSAPAGIATPLAGPAATIRPSRTTIVALAIGGRSVPSIRVAPVNARTGATCACTESGTESTARPEASSRTLRIGDDLTGQGLVWVSLYDSSHYRKDEHRFRRFHRLRR